LHPAFENLDDDHAAATAWAWRSRIFCCDGSNRLRRWLWRNREQFSRTREIYFTATAGEQAVVADAVEALWEDMQEKAPDELVDGERHGALTVWAIAAVIFVAEGHARLIKGDQPAV
jgi:hypothetical protein